MTAGEQRLCGGSGEDGAASNGEGAVIKYEDRDFSDLIGLTLASVESDEGSVTFTTTEGRILRLEHIQDCCESVYIEDICGDLQGLVGSPVLLAEESSNSDDPPPVGREMDYSYTWTFYRIATANGHVVIRFLGESNGYYSETADFIEVIP